MVIVCSKCGSSNSDRHTHCLTCGAQTQEYCPVCHCLHPVVAAFCPNSGKNIADYKAEVERKKEVEKQFDEIFPKNYRKACVVARWKAFIVSLLCWEAFHAIIMIGVGLLTSLEAVFGSFIIKIIAALILIATFAATGVSYEYKREELLDAYLKDKILGEKN
jgi:hypothetical protein